MVTWGHKMSNKFNAEIFNFIIALISTKRKEQFKQVDSKFGTSAEGVINVNYEELDEKKDLEEQQVENKNEVSSLSELKVEG